MATLLGAQLNTLDLETLKVRGYGAPVGGNLTYSSATALLVSAGQFRDSTDAYNLTPGAATLSITTIAAINGLDETTCSATATTHGTATFEPSASLYLETPLANTVRTGTGTITGAGTTITGTSTLFLSELKIGDLIRSTSTGATRVTAIASDTSLTVAVAFPGGSPGGSGFTIYENAIVRIAAETPQRIKSITHAGTSVVVGSAWTSSTSGVAIKLGGEIVSARYNVFAVYGGSGHGYILSSQRTRPYNVTGYTTAWRCVGSVGNDSSGDFIPFYQFGAGSTRFYHQSSQTVLSSGTATSFTRLDCSPYVGQSAKAIFMTASLDKTGGGGTFSTIEYKPGGGAATVFTQYSDDFVATTLRNNMTATLACDGCQVVEYKGTTATFAAYMFVWGWVEEI